MIPLVCTIAALLTCSCLGDQGSSVNSVTAGQVDDDVLRNVAESPGDWLTYGRNYSEDRHSPLDQINKSTIDSLGLDWSINLGTIRGIEATPLVVDGIMYFTGPWSVAYAVDARKGEVLWTFDPEVPKEYGEKTCCDVVNRGLAIYEGRIFLGSLDGRLIALDASNGSVLWEELTVDPDKAQTITGAPRVIDGKVIIGNGGAEYGVRGYVTAYDAKSGEEKWRFYTVPGNPSDGFESDAMKMAAETWNGEWWKYGGGGTAWDAMAFDPELNLLYIGTGNGAPWNREFRSPGGGDNLFLSSIVALNPDDGSFVWHYQTTPGDSWDYTATQPLILADIELDGRTRKVIMQAPKNGFFYVIDRTNGSFISAEPFAYTNWAKSIDQETGRPVETPDSRYIDSNTQIAPDALGAHSWHPMAFNPHEELVYIPAKEGSMVFGQDPNFSFTDDARTWNTGTGFDPSKPEVTDPDVPSPVGKLIAWSPKDQEEKWSVELKSIWNGGVLSTKELVFQGNGEGDLVAYDAGSGEQLWSFPLKTGIVAPPISYMLDGVQYISVLAGWGGGLALWFKQVDAIRPGALYTFKLGGSLPLPEFPKAEPELLVDLDFEATAEQVFNGEILYSRYCGKCHGGGVIPSLLFSKPEIFDSFQSIVGEGAFLGKGMPRFGDRISKEGIQDIRSFILSSAKSLRESE